MLNFLITAGLSAVVTFASVFGVYNYVPLKYLANETDKNLGGGDNHNYFRIRYLIILSRGNQHEFQ